MKPTSSLRRRHVGVDTSESGMGILPMSLYSAHSHGRYARATTESRALASARRWTRLHIALVLLGALQTMAMGGAASFDVRRFGAIADGTTLNTVAIQKAIDTCHAAGGGRVVVAGGVYLSGAVQLRSRVTLVLTADATLLGSPNIADYRVVTEPIDWGWTYKKTAIAFAPCLIYAEKAEHVGVEGKGTVDGQGGQQRKVFPNRGDPDLRRPILVRFHECRDIALRDVTLVDPAAYATFFVHSRDIVVEGVTIRSRQTVNGDGLDFDGCRNVRIDRCDLDCGDDAISPKTSHPDWPAEDYLVTNCRMHNTAIRLGAESIAPIRRFTARDCQMIDCYDGIKIESSEGATHEDLLFEHLEMQNVGVPFYVTASRFNFSAHAQSARPSLGRIRGLRIRNVRATVREPDRSARRSRSGAAIVSLPGYGIEDVELSEVELICPGGAAADLAGRLDVPEMLHYSVYYEWAFPFGGELPSSGLYLRHLRNVRLHHVRMTTLQPDRRAFIAGDDVDGLVLDGVVGQAAGAVAGLAKLAEARRVKLEDSRIVGAQAPLLAVLSAEEAERLRDLRLRSRMLDEQIQQAADAEDLAQRAAPLLSLPAAWRFRADPRSEGEAAGWFVAEPDTNWTDMVVEQPWAKLTAVPPGGSAWYATSFDLPASASGRRSFLRFGAVNGKCRVWLDGAPVGQRSIDPLYSWKFPVALETTGLVKAGRVHRLVVRVERPSNNERVMQEPIEIRLEP